MTGKALQRAIIDLARTHGWMVAHFPMVQDVKRGWRTPVAADGKGWPDLVLVRDRVVFVEVKGRGDRMRPDQEKWRHSLRLAGQEHHVWGPDDWTLGEIDKVLTRRRSLLHPDPVPVPEGWA